LNVQIDTETASTNSKKRLGFVNLVLAEVKKLKMKEMQQLT
jgi:hypothetical protein